MSVIFFSFSKSNFQPNS